MSGVILGFPKIWFLRHGQTEWNVAGRIQGRLDSPLTDLGREQATQQARIVDTFAQQVESGSGGIFVSPQGRAQKTAKLALGSRPFVVDTRLSEINTGEWEGQLKAEVATQGSDLEVYSVAPGGEGFSALEARVRGFLIGLKGPSIVVSHGLLGQVMRGVILGLDRPEMSELTNGQGVVYELCDGREFVLE